jgi:cytoskeletal protein CcmA (bactofilin family)
MKFGKRESGAPTDLRSFLGEGTEITGDIRFTEIMRVDAKITGTVQSDSGILLVMEKGYVKADVKAGGVEVGGTVEGKITAQTSVKILATGRVYGDFHTPALMIEYGAVFEGKCSMARNKERASEDRPRLESKGAAEVLSLKIS